MDAVTRKVAEVVPPPPGTPDRWKSLWYAAGRNILDEEAIAEFGAHEIAEAESDLEAWHASQAGQDAVTASNLI